MLRDGVSMKPRKQRMGKKFKTTTKTSAIGARRKNLQYWCNVTISMAFEMIERKWLMTTCFTFLVASTLSQCSYLLNTHRICIVLRTFSNEYTQRQCTLCSEVCDNISVCLCMSCRYAEIYYRTPLSHWLSPSSCSEMRKCIYDEF